MANIGTPRNKSELVRDSLLQVSNPGFLRYQGIFKSSGTHAAQELFLNGEDGHRLVLPTDSYVFGSFYGAAWNRTSGDSPCGALIHFGIENDGGVVAAPAFATGTNKAAVAAGQAGGTFAVLEDNVNKALIVTFDPQANTEWVVCGTLYYAFAADKMMAPNFHVQTQ